MSFFKNLFGQNKGQDALTDTMKQFNQEWFEAVKRFAIIAGFKDFRFDLKHPDTGEVMQPHIGMAGTFEDWQQITSPWDRRRLLFELIFNSVAGSMAVWQQANIFVAIRQPDRAVTLLEQVSIPDSNSDDYINYCEAFARALQYYQKPKDAIEWARKAYATDDTLQLVQLRLADVLFITGECDEANTIYSSRMKSIESKEPKTNSSIAVMFSEMFALETGAIHSPVFAIDIGEKLTTPQQAQEFWALAEIEFYDSAYFRMQHAYYLLKQGDNARALTKLIALVQEMPWLQEASLNLELLFKQFDPDGVKMMPDFQQQLRQTISRNGWTVDGMNQMSIDQNS